MDYYVKCFMKTGSGGIETAGDFSVIVNPYLWKWLKNDDDRLLKVTYRMHPSQGTSTIFCNQYRLVEFFMPFSDFIYDLLFNQLYSSTVTVPGWITIYTHYVHELHLQHVNHVFSVTTTLTSHYKL